VCNVIISSNLVAGHVSALPHLNRFVTQIHGHTVKDHCPKL
jgi:hypothetical protein